MATIAENLEIIRAMLGLTRQQIADLLEIHANTWSYWVSGKGVPSTVYIIKLSELSGIDVGQICAGSLREKLKR